MRIDILPVDGAGGVCWVLGVGGRVRGLGSGAGRAAWALRGLVCGPRAGWLVGLVWGGSVRVSSASCSELVYGAFDLPESPVDLGHQFYEVWVLYELVWGMGLGLV